MFDTNVFLDGRIRWYRPEIFSSLWQNIEKLAVNGQAHCPREVSIELEQGDQECAAWVRSIDGLVSDADQDVVNAVAAIAAQFPGWVTPEVNYADPFVIAHAQVRGWAVVTADKRTGPDTVEDLMRIPDVCDHLGLECIGLPDIIKREGWTP